MQRPVGATAYKLVQAHAAKSLILEIVEKTWGIDMNKLDGQLAVFAVVAPSDRPKNLWQAAERRRSAIEN